MNDARVFFYGLFMDARLLARKGVRASSTSVGLVEGRQLRIGKRATLVPDGASRAHGVLVTMPRADLEVLYADPTVADYVPEEVSVTLADGSAERALCYVLPASALEGTNAAYAAALLELASELGFPAAYLDAIRREGEAR